MSSSGPMRQQLSKAADRIHQAADAVKTSSQDGSASVTGDPPSVKDHLQAASPEARSSRVADLAKRAAGLAEIVQRAAAGEKPKAGPAISGRSPSEHPLAEKVLESQ